MKYFKLCCWTTWFHRPQQDEKKNENHTPIQQLRRHWNCVTHIYFRKRRPAKTTLVDIKNKNKKKRGERYIFKWSIIIFSVWHVEVMCISECYYSNGATPYSWQKKYYNAPERHKGEYYVRSVEGCDSWQDIWDCPRWHFHTFFPINLCHFRDFLLEINWIGGLVTSFLLFFSLKLNRSDIRERWYFSKKKKKYNFWSILEWWDLCRWIIVNFFLMFFRFCAVDRFKYKWIFEVIFVIISNVGIW